MKKTQRSAIIANAFGTLGYLSVLFQWVWSLLLFAYPSLKEDSSGFLQPQQPTVTPPPIEINPDIAPLLSFIAIVATAIILAITAVTLVRLPKTFGKKAASVSQSTARTVLPLVIRHKKISKKKRLQLSHRIILALKVLAIITPLILLVFTPSILELGKQTAWAIGIFTATCSAIYFALQQLIAWSRKVPRTDLW